MKKIDRNNAESIRAGIKSVVGRSRTLQNDIQTVALATLFHTKEHGDWTLSRELIEGLTANKGVKSAKLTQYFEAMMSATYGEDDKGHPAFIYDEGKSHSDINIEMAEAVMWYDFKGPQKDNSKDLEEIQNAVFRMLKKSFEADKITEAERSAVNDLLATLVEARANGEVVELTESEAA